MPDGSQLRARALLDLERRTFAGSQAYLVAWFAVAADTGILRRHLGVTLAVATSFAVTSVARAALHRQLPHLVQHRLPLAAALYRVVLLVGAAQFGVLTAGSILWPPLRPAQLSLVFGAVVICTAGTMALAFDRWARFGFPLAIGIPVAAAVARGSDTPMLLLAPAFYGYLILTSKYINHDYWDAAHAAELLQQRAAELETLSITDPLTQLANRLHFDHRLNHEWAAAVSAHSPVSVLVIDIDHFKWLNDAHGHPFGDQCLIRIAGALSANLRRADGLVARYGGEEFTALLPGAHQQDAERVAERLRAAVADLRIEWDHTPVPLTCSIGSVTAYPAPEGPTASQALTSADQALYRAKADGRNRVALADLSIT